MNEGSKETNKNRTAFRLGRKMSFFALTPTITTTIADAKRVADAKFKLRLALRECMQCGLQIICLLRSMSSSPNMPDDIGTFLEGFYLFGPEALENFQFEWINKFIHEKCSFFWFQRRLWMHFLCGRQLPVCIHQTKSQFMNELNRDPLMGWSYLLSP